MCVWVSVCVGICMWAPKYDCLPACLPACLIADLPACVVSPERGCPYVALPAWVYMYMCVPLSAYMKTYIHTGTQNKYIHANIANIQHIQYAQYRHVVRLTYTDTHTRIHTYTHRQSICIYPSPCLYVMHTAPSLYVWLDVCLSIPLYVALNRAPQDATTTPSKRVSPLSLL